MAKKKYFFLFSFCNMIVTHNNEEGVLRGSHGKEQHQAPVSDLLMSYSESMLWLQTARIEESDSTV